VQADGSGNGVGSTEANSLSRRPLSSRRSWRIGAGALLAIALIVGLVILTSAAASGLRTELRRGRVSLTAARDALARGRVDDSALAFAEAERRFDDAAARSDGTVTNLLGIVPVLGRSIDLADDLADVGSEFARAGLAITDGIRAIPGGLGAFAPHDGTLTFRGLGSLSAALERSQSHARTAAAIATAAPSSLLLGQAEEARWEAMREATWLTDTISAARSIVESLPAFAGQGEPRHYLLAAESPAELRGTGGIWGAYAIVDMRAGAIDVSGFRPTGTLPDPDPASLPGVQPDLIRNFAAYGGEGFWRNVNATRDFPSAAQAALAAYARVTGEQLDGVIVTDPFALQILLEITGPTGSASGGGADLDAGSVVSLTSNEAYGRFDSAESRKGLLGAVATTVFRRFITMERADVARLLAIGNAVASGHLKVYPARDPALVEAMRQLGVDGGLPEPGGDVLAVTVNSASGSKVDFYSHRRVVHEVVLGPGGSAVSSTDITIANEAPRTGLPASVLRPRAPGIYSGDNVSSITITCAFSCDLLDAQRDGDPTELTSGRELRLPFYRDLMTTAAGGAHSLHIRSRSSDVWQGDSSSGSYRLTLVGQTSINPSTAEVAIRAPEGQHITWTSEPMSVQGGLAVWEGEPAPLTVLEVRFAATLPLRIWRDLTRGL
jgi:hypothetical protein